MEKIYLSSEEYDAAVNAYRKKHGYDDMSEEEQKVFDERLDKVVGKEDDSDASEDAESMDSSDEQKRAFGEKLDEVIGLDSSGDEDPDQPEKVLKLTRSR